MKKNYFLDTNVLLHDASSIFQFQDNNVIIPICVIEELDSFKKAPDERGCNARQVSRTLDKLREQGKLSDGVPLPTGGSLCIELNHCNHEKVSELIQNRPDNRILATALHISQRQPDHPTIIVTKDVNLRIKADAFGITAEDYETDHTPIEELYSGFCELDVTDSVIDAIFEKGTLPLASFSENGSKQSFYPNQYAILRASGKASALARVETAQKGMALLRNGNRAVWGIGPKNKEQKFAIDVECRISNVECRISNDPAIVSSYPLSVVGQAKRSARSAGPCRVLEFN